MWTPAFVGVNAAAYLAIWAVLTFLFDARAGAAVDRVRTVVAAPFVAVGRNALVLWTGVFVVGKVLTATPVAGVPLGDHLLAERGAAGFFALTAGGWLAVASAMHAARWYVRL